MSNKCETCDDSGYVWLEDKRGQGWLCDCPDEECNAFGQMDVSENCDKCAKARKTAGGQWHCVEHGELDI